jgi:hypothetical protein
LLVSHRRRGLRSRDAIPKANSERLQKGYEEATQLAMEGKLDEFNRLVQKQSKLTDFTREQKELLDNLQRSAGSNYLYQQRRNNRKDPSDSNLDSTASAD